MLHCSKTTHPKLDARKPQKLIVSQFGWPEAANQGLPGLVPLKDLPLHVTISPCVVHTRPRSVYDFHCVQIPTSYKSPAQNRDYSQRRSSLQINSQSEVPGVRVSTDLFLGWGRGPQFKLMSARAHRGRR